MKKVLEYLSVFVGGGAVYALLEIIFRGYTHWSMLIVGGAAVLSLYLLSAMHEPAWRKWIMGAVSILAIEFVAGIILNIQLDWRVWDYSAYKLNLYGQICLPFAMCWLALSIPATAICSFIRRKIFLHRSEGMDC